MEELTLTTPSLLFSAVSLLLLAYTNRFLSYAQVVRTLKEKYTTKLKDTREDSLDKKIKKASKPKQKPIKYSKSKGKTFESDFDDIKGIAVFLVVITALVYLYLNIN